MCLSGMREIRRSFGSDQVMLQVKYASRCLQGETSEIPRPLRGRARVRVRVYCALTVLPLSLALSPRRPGGEGNFFSLFEPVVVNLPLAFARMGRNLKPARQ